MSTIACLECHRSGDWDVLYMRLRARTLLSRYWCGVCDWNMQSSETVWCECRKSRSWREKCDWKFFNKTSLGGAARTASHDIGAIYAIENWHLFNELLRDFPSAAGHVIGSLAPDIVEKTFDRISRANIVTSATRNISKAWSTSKKFNRISRANIVTSATRNISKRWSTSKNFNRISRANIVTSPLATSPKLGRLQKIFNRISRANIVTSATRNISKAWSTSKNFQSHFSRQYRD